MGLDWGLYVLASVLTIGLGFLTYQDRLFGIAGMLLGFVMDSILFNDNGITFNNTYSITGATATLPYVIVLGILTILDVAIFFHVNSERKDLLNKSNQEG